MLCFHLFNDLSMTKCFSLSLCVCGECSLFDIHDIMCINVTAHSNNLIAVLFVQFWCRPTVGIVLVYIPVIDTGKITIFVLGRMIVMP